MDEFCLEEYLSNGIENMMKGMVKAALIHPHASKFMIQHSMDSRMARKKRAASEQNGQHIPPFLIASITNQCNLHCTGCYARATNACTDGACQPGMLSAAEWNELFGQASDLGIEFILLAGGEPFVRTDVLSAAGKNRKIIFPIFTNGTMIDDTGLSLLEQNRNLIPVISMEGNEKTTDERRGKGIYAEIQKKMECLKKKGIVFGASITVSKGNMEEVLSRSFLAGLAHAGVKAVVFVEYVPVNGDTDAALDEWDRSQMSQTLFRLRTADNPLLLLSFPGDEKASGGCLAAGRGFFHINAYGGAEPCPFSPYSDSNVKETTLLGALQSPLFSMLRQNGALMEEHSGGCTLFEQQKQVQSLLSQVMR
jgi:MoaA/NifB/PqqE/SkfB family radical SAM enzyme